MLTWLALAILPAVLHVMEAVVRQFLLVAQGFPEVFHRLLAGAALALTLALTLGDLHVVHEIAQLLHQGLRFRSAALFHQLLQLVQHLLQLVLGHLHRLAVGLVRLVRVLRVFLRLLLHVIVQSLTHFLHQAVNLSRTGAIADCCVQPVLRTFHRFERRGQGAVFDHQGNLPQLLCDIIARFEVERGRDGVEFPDRHAQAQIGFGVGHEAFGFVGDGFQHLDHPRGIAAVPQQIAAHFHQCSGERFKEPAAGQDHMQRLGGGLLTGGIGGGEGERHGQVGHEVFGQIIDQHLIDLGAVALHGQRQIECHRRAGFGVTGQAIFAVDQRQVQRDGHVALDHTVVIGRLERLFEAAIGVAVHLALGGDGRRHVGQDGDQPFAASGAVDGKATGLLDHEILHRLAGGGHVGAARYGLSQDQRAGCAVKAQLDAGACGQKQRLVLLVGEVECGFAGIGGRLGPAFPSRASSGLALATRCGQRGDGGDPPQRAEDQCQHQHGQRHVTQRIRIAGGQAQVGLHRAGIGGAAGHAVAVHVPDGFGGGVVRPHRKAVAQGCDRAAGQAGVKPGQGIFAGWFAKGAPAVDQRPDRGKRQRDHAKPIRLQRQVILHPQSGQPQPGDEQGPQGPERTAQPFRPKPQQGQAKGGFDPFQGRCGLVFGHSLRPVRAKSSGRNPRAMQEWYLGSGFRQSLVGRG